jgi:hypothetical protein
MRPLRNEPCQRGDRGAFMRNLLCRLEASRATPVSDVPSFEASSACQPLGRSATEIMVVLSGGRYEADFLPFARRKSSGPVRDPA